MRKDRGATGPKGGRARRVAAKAFLTAALAACGRYGQPFAPERLGPKAVEFVEVRGLGTGIEFTWRSPEEDNRGETLESLGGYRVYRKEIVSGSDVVDVDVPFELVSTIPDTAFEALAKRKEEAREKNRPTRRMKRTEEEKTVRFLDSAPRQGKTYLYKVVAWNRGDTDGDYREFVKVLFLGAASQIARIESGRDDPSLIQGGAAGLDDRADQETNEL